MVNQDWFFPNGTQINGLNDSGIAMFEGTPYKSLAREICQNSLDANSERRRLERGFIEPAIVEFDLKEIAFTDIPGANSLKNSLIKGKVFWKKQGIEKSSLFYEKAVELTSEMIPVLRISDFNTTGLLGSKGTYNTPWINMTRSTGVSDKNNADGGSFGIGKYAPFATSRFRTIFYNTVDIEGIHAFQGISRLTSFEDVSGNLTDGIGYYGSESFLPIHENKSIFPKYTRLDTEQGTDIFVLGFTTYDRQWKGELIGSILDGFLYAIYNKQLVVKVNELKIDSENLSHIIKNYNEYITEYANEYFLVLTSDQTVWINKGEIQGMGPVCVGILEGEGFHNNVAMIRKTGMKIKNYAHKNPLINYSGICIILNDELNTQLRKIENPQHTNWEPPRWTDRIPYAKKLVHSVYGFVRDEIKKLVTINEEDEVDADIGEYLPLLSNEEDQEGLSESISDKVREVLEKKRSPLNSSSKAVGKENKKQAIVDNEGELEEEISVPSGHKQSDKHRKNDVPNTDTPGGGYGSAYKLETVNSNYETIGVLDFRSLALDKKNGTYSLLITPNSDGTDGKIILKLKGESLTEKVKIKNVMNIPPNPEVSFSGNQIENISFIEGQQIRLKVDIDYDEYAIMEVSLRAKVSE